MEVKFMERALVLAERGRGKTKTNPLVGAVIVKNGKIIGEGYHAYFGGPHAERMAIENAIEDVAGSEIYVTLEPCCHHGKQPPCTDAIIESGIKKVYISLGDIDPRVVNQGGKILKAKGIEVEMGILEEKAREQNREYLLSKRENRPFVTMKFAASLDGKIATYTGESQWITSEESRRDGHKLRGMVDGILVGTHTALEDNPTLNNRLEEGNDPVKLLLDRELKVDIHSNLYQVNGEKLMVFTSSSDQKKWREREEMGAKIFSVDAEDGLLDLEEILHIAYEHDIGHLLVEGGGEVHGSFLEKNLIDGICLYYAPVFIGGIGAPSAVKGRGIGSLADLPQFSIEKIERMGEDIKVQGVRRCLQVL